MPIIVLLLLTAACVRVPWPEPPFGFGGSGSLALTAFAFLLPVGGAIVLSRWAASAVRHEPDRRGEIAKTYGRFRRLLGYANLLVCVLAVVGLGWGWTVWHRAVLPSDRSLLAPMAELLVPAPYIFAVFAVWIIHYDAERAFHSSANRSDQPFWSRTGYFVFQLRSFAFLVFLPLVLFAANQTFLRLAPETAGDWRSQLAAFLVMPLLFVVLPLFVKPALGLQSLPAGPARDRLEAIARREKFRCTDLLHWPTRGQMLNAMVLGLVPRARYVVFTDKLLESLTPDELDAVFGHEIGHVRYQHLPYYLLFLMLSFVAVMCAVDAGMGALAAGGWIDAVAWEPWAALPPLAALFAYIFLAFGFLSRRCERQADLHGCRVASGGDGITPLGIAAMIKALERVGDASDVKSSPVERRPSFLRRTAALVRSWQHGSIPERIEYLLSLLEQPEREGEFQRRVYRLKWAIVLGLVAFIAAIGSIVGWDEMIKTLLKGI